jgi:hypothetical protein
MHLRVMAVLVAAAGVAGCVPDTAKLSMTRGRWTDYRDMGIHAADLALKDNPAPTEVKHRFAVCLADWTHGFITPDELKILDPYARGEREVRIGEMRQLDAAFKSRAPVKGVTAGNIDVLSSACPQDVPDFKKYNLPKA